MSRTRHTQGVGHMVLGCEGLFSNAFTKIWHEGCVYMCVCACVCVFIDTPMLANPQTHANTKNEIKKQYTTCKSAGTHRQDWSNVYVYKHVCTHMCV